MASFLRTPACLLLLAGLWAGSAHAQSAPWTNFEECPGFPPVTAEILRWEAMRLPDMVLCRAIVQDGGAEAFALTISRESPFKPRRADRAEESTLNGRELYWYSSELPSQPDLLIRETLIPIAENRVVHVSLRANDAANLAKYQDYVVSLPFPDYED
jgi:hypothetical protein